MTQARKPNILILLAGLGTSFLCLLAVYLLNLVEFNLMGLYVLFIIPAGGLVVGAGSGTGYAIASRLSNVRIRKQYYIVIILVALATYAASHYVTYLVLLAGEGIAQERFSFLKYIQFTVENTVYSLKDDTDGFELGKWGYAFLAIEAIGFSIGTLFPSFMISRSAYCPSCQLYMKRAATGYFPGAITRADMKRRPIKEKMAILEQAIAEAKDNYQSMIPDLEKKDLAELQVLLTQNYSRPKTDKLAFVQVELFRCPDCDTVIIRTSINNFGFDGKLRIQQLPEIRRGLGWTFGKDNL